MERRAVVAAFDGGHVSSDGGALLLSQLDRAIGLVEQFARCFLDRRDPDLIEHTVSTLVGQRVLGLAMGYEDLNDHDQLRHAPALCAALGKLAAKRSDCVALAGKSTLNCLEHVPGKVTQSLHFLSRLSHQCKCPTPKALRKNALSPKSSTVLIVDNPNQLLYT